MTDSKSKTPIDQAAALVMWNDGWTLSMIARHMGTTRATVYGAVQRAAAQGLGIARRGHAPKPEQAPPLAAMWDHHTDAAQ